MSRNPLAEYARLAALGLKPSAALLKAAGACLEASQRLERQMEADLWTGEHFGVTADGEKWVSEELIRFAGEAAKTGKVLKEIEVTMKSGKTYKKKVWVNSEDAKAAALAAKQKAKDDAKSGKLNAKADSYTAAKGAFTDPAKADPKAVGKHLANLDKSSLVALKKELGIKGGATKAELNKKILDTFKAKKKAATAKKPEPAQKKDEPKPAAAKKEPKPAAATAQGAKKADAQKAVPSTGVKAEAEAAIADIKSANLPKLAGQINSLTKAEVVELGSKIGLKSLGGLPKDKAVQKFVNTLKAQKQTYDIAFAAKEAAKTAGGKPSNHFASVDPEDGFAVPSPAFKKDHPHANAKALGDSFVTGRPNNALTDDTRPAVKDKATAKYINNYSWGYDGEMNAALRNTGSPPPGKFGGSKTTEFEDGKPDVDGPKMYAALRGQFKAAKPFGPPPREVYRGIDVDAKTRDSFAADAIRAKESGGTIKLNGFQSTSTDPDGAFGGNVQFKIKAIHGIDTKPYSHFPTENELLLNHGCEYRVLKVEKKGYDYEIHLEQVTTGN